MERIFEKINKPLSHPIFSAQIQERKAEGRSLPAPNFGLIQKKVNKKTELLNDDSQDYSNNSKSMDKVSKENMEYSFGQDFSDIKIHENSSLATKHQAKAFTQGNHIHFAPGQYKPSTKEGQFLLGHELAHTIQQKTNAVRADYFEEGVPVNNSESLEREANQMGKMASEGRRFQSTSTEVKNLQSGNVVQKLSLFSHGFLTSRDKFGYKGASERKKGKEAVFANDYNDYWKEFDDKFAERLGDNNILYFDGSAAPLSKAKKRMKYGMKAADAIHSMFLKENLNVQYNQDKTEIDEKIVLIGHSMGAAYAAGMAKRLDQINKECGKQIYKIDTLYLVAPHQPEDIDTPDGMRVVQYSHARDSVSSKGIVPRFSGSKLAPVNSDNLAYRVYDDDNWSRKIKKEAGGHYIDTHDYIFSEYEEDDAAYVKPIGKAK